MVELKGEYEYIGMRGTEVTLLYHIVKWPLGYGSGF